MTKPRVRNWKSLGPRVRLSPMLVLAFRDYYAWTQLPPWGKRDIFRLIRGGNDHDSFADYAAGIATSPWEHYLADLVRRMSRTQRRKLFAIH